MSYLLISGFACRRGLHALTSALCLLFAGCASINMGDATQPIQTRLIAASNATTHRTPAHRILVIVLPGRGDDVAVLGRVGIAPAIQKAWPDADVILTGTAMAYYMQSGVWQRLHDEIVEPARSRGYTEIWMAGASIGGMGALLYEQHYPGELKGIVLLAPYLGEPPLSQEITTAGGLPKWQPGTLPAMIDANNFQHELWRWLKTWTAQPDVGQRVWSGYGDRDKPRYAFPNFTPLLPKDHVFVRSGWHAWATWTPLIAEIFGRIRAEQAKASR